MTFDKTKYGIGYNSNHEFWGVLREEVQEANEEVQDIIKQVEEKMWKE